MSSGKLPEVGSEEERRHFLDVVKSYNEYGAYAMKDVIRKRNNMLSLSPDQLSRLPGGKKGVCCNIDMLVNAVHTNNSLCWKIASSYNSFQHEQSTTEEERLDGRQDDIVIESSGHSMSKVVSTLHQLSREWSSEGSEERSQCMIPMLEELENCLPVTDANKNVQRVLAPGCGAGRLVLELASRGYEVQGNEFSYVMLLASTYMLNKTSHVDEICIHPWIDKRCNNWSNANMARPIYIPDLSPMDVMHKNPGLNVSMCAGEFLEVYSKQSSNWDAILTCFFIDTAPNIFDYIIPYLTNFKCNICVWINMGPLLYHWANASVGENDCRYEQSIELSYDELIHVIKSFGFIIRREEKRHSTYASDGLSMMGTVYNTAFFTARKPLTKP
eukprot:GSMAST32.ASY1.ANO1.336.1 assembled CDS